MTNKKYADKAALKVSMESDLKEWLAIQARREDRTVNAVIVRAVKEYKERTAAVVA